MKRLIRTASIAALATSLLVAAGCSGSDSGEEGGSGSSQSVEKVTYLTSFGNFGRDSYAWVAKDKGFFKEAGFEVDIKPGTGTGDNIKMISAGKAMFTPLDLTGLLLARGGDTSPEAKDISVIAGIQQRTMAAIVTLEGNNISTPKDLEGKKIADSPSSVVRNLFPTYAKLAGVDATKVEWVNGTPQTLIGTLAGGAVQGIGQFVVGKPTVEAVAKKPAVLLPYSDVMTDLYGNVLVTSTKLAKEKPDMVKRFTAALLKGLEYSIDNPEESGQILNKNVPEQLAAPAAAECTLMAAFVRSAGSGTAVGTIDTARVARSIAILQGAGAIPSGLTPEQFIDANLTPKA